jgi:four helix bundle protein
MATFKTFEEIDAWKNARILADKIFKLTLEGSFAKDFKLRDQINGSSGSIMDNIAEGFERSGNREFIQFLSIAKGSAGETRSQLYRALDRNHITAHEFNSLNEEVTQVSKQISSLMGYLKSSDLKGIKFIKEPKESYNSTNLEL